MNKVLTIVAAVATTAVGVAVGMWAYNKFMAK